MKTGHQILPAIEFYTPRDVVRLMVRLLEPREEMRIYDPCVGSGGMLILSKQYVEENGGNPRNVRLFGQDANGGVWSICKMNMLLHGIADADIQNDDTLANPLHLEGGELMGFDRVISNPPFSQNYSRQGMKFAERFKYGFCPETGKKGDLMFAQHMFSVLRGGGMMATVMPHGVLFRGGVEQEIRKQFIVNDHLEAVIGLPPNLFYGTGIPACILVMRAKGAKPPERQGKVLFINADAEYYSGRAQNYLRPEHVEKIVSTFQAFRDVPGYAAVVSRADLEANDFNCNIRRYADNTPPPEPQDVRAHLLGGVPTAEVAAKMDLFRAHGFDPSTIFEPRDEVYLDFVPTLTARNQIKPLLENDPGIQAQETRVYAAFHAWWQEQEQQIRKLPINKQLMPLRAHLLASFAQALAPAGLLDRYKVDGVIASWWSEVQYDLRTLAAQGFEGLMDSWVASAHNVLEEDVETSDSVQFAPQTRGLVARLFPKDLEEVEIAEAKRVELKGQLEAAIKGDVGEDEEADSENEVEEAVDEEYIRTLERELADARRRVQKLKAELDSRLTAKRAELTIEECQRLVIEIMHDDLWTLAALGFEGLVDGWVDTVRIALAENEANTSARFDPLNHKLVMRLLPEYLEEVEAAEAKKAELESQVEATKKASDEEGDEAESGSEDEEAPDEEEIKRLKKDLADAKKKVQQLKKELDSRLAWKRAELKAEDCQQLALGILRDDLAAQLERYVIEHRRQVIAAVENWWDKYHVTLRDIEGERNVASLRLAEFMEALGYAR